MAESKKFISKLNVTNPETGQVELYDIILPSELGLYLSMAEDGVTPKNLKIAPSKNFYSKANLLLEPEKDLRIKAGDDICLYSDNVEDSSDLEQVLVKALCGVYDDGTGNRVERDEDIPVRLKLNASELEVNTDGSEDVDTLDIKFKTGRKDGQGERYPQVKYKGRSFDIRCYEHGGIALQIAGKDGDGHENKIKFESDRTTDVSNSSAIYCGTGGDGIEFGTFNTQHSSLHSKDYRFNKNGMVYATERGDLVYNSTTGKKDYPTQGDDFKDILVTTDGTQCTYESGSWKVPEGKRVLGATWGDIVYLGSKKAVIESLIATGTGTGEGGSGSGCKVSDEDVENLSWLNNNYSALDSFLTTGLNTIKTDIGNYSSVDPDTSSPIEASGLCKKVEDLESKVSPILENNITITSKGNLEIANPDNFNINIESTQDTKISAEGLLKLKSNSGVSFDETSDVIFLNKKVNSTGIISPVSTSLSLGSYNHLGRDYYSCPDGKIKIVLDSPLYTSAGVTLLSSDSTKTSSISAKINAFTDSEATIPVDKGVQEIYFLKDVNNVIWVCAINSDHQVKKDDSNNKTVSKRLESSFPLTCTAAQGLYNNVIFVDPGYTPASDEILVPAEAVDISTSIPAEELISKVKNPGKLEDVVKGVDPETGNITISSEDKLATVNDVCKSLSTTEFVLTKTIGELTELINSYKNAILELQEQVRALGGTIAVNINPES